MDVRLTGCGRDVDMTIQQAIKKNRLQKVRPPTLSSSSRSSSPASGGQTPTKEKKKYPYPKLWIHQIIIIIRLLDDKISYFFISLDLWICRCRATRLVTRAVSGMILGYNTKPKIWNVMKIHFTNFFVKSNLDIIHFSRIFWSNNIP